MDYFYLIFFTKVVYDSSILFCEFNSDCRLGFKALVCLGKALSNSSKMPKIKQLEKCKHPNSRKTKALAKQLKKQNTREKNKLSNNIKLNLIGEKLLWFQQHLDTNCKTCTVNNVETLILKYLARFKEELEQIQLKHSIGNRKNRQHASREDIIKLTMKREIEEYNTCGLEIPNLLEPSQFELLRTWNGELRFLQNFKLRRFSKKVIEEEKKKLSKTASQNTKQTCMDISEDIQNNL